MAATFHSLGPRTGYLISIADQYTGIIGFPRGLGGKESSCNAGDLGLIVGSVRSPGGGNGNPLQYSCLENSKDREIWWAIVHGVTKSQTSLSD